MKKFFFITFTLTLFLSGCGGGGGGSGATVILKDASGVEINADGTSTGVNPTFFTATFSEEVAPSTVNSTNVTMTCMGEEVTLADTNIVADSTNTIFTITPPTLYGYQKLDCTITFAAGIQTIAAATDFTFTNGCATTDAFVTSDTINFTTQTDGCWTVFEPNANKSSSISFVDSTNLDLLGFGLRFTSNLKPLAQWDSVVFYKSFPKTDTDWSAKIYLGQFSGYSGDSEAGASIVVAPLPISGTTLMSAGIYPNESKCKINQYGGGQTIASCSVTAKSIILLQRSGTAFLMKYVQNGDGTYDVDVGPYTDGGITESGSSVAIGMAFSASETNNVVVTEGSIEFIGNVATGQY